MEAGSVTRVVILGGGFGGIYAALRFERALARGEALEVTLVNRENFFLFTPMLHEVAASDLDLTHIVNPIRKLLRRVRFVEGEVDGIDLVQHRVSVAHGGVRHAHDLSYDHLILALGAVTNFHGLAGVEERALTMKSLGDAIYLRNRLIESLEEAEPDCASDARSALLTFVVAGGGFAGVETVGALHDFVREALPFYPALHPEYLRVVLVHELREVRVQVGFTRLAPTEAYLDGDAPAASSSRSPRYTSAHGDHPGPRTPRRESGRNAAGSRKLSSTRR